MRGEITISAFEGPLPGDLDLEIAERKGVGHPDTLSDLIAEEASLDLCRFYLEEAGAIMHHNVDKALLVGGEAEPAFGGGRITRPMEVIIAGRAIKSLNGRELPVDEITTDSAKRVLRKTLRNMDTGKSAVVRTMVRPGSRDLIALFDRFGRGETPLSNDTSVGAGFYPLDPLESAVYDTERLLNGPETKKNHPYIGEDVKVMGVRRRGNITLTLAVAFVDKYVSGIDDYKDKKREIASLIKRQDRARENLEIEINTADDYDSGSVYLTVTGTSAEQGDDGQVGRGNRVNGLITPYRPMTLEAAAGKNPVSHVGKLYNIFAQELCRTIVEKGFARDAYAFLVSQIGKPINEPQALDIRVTGKTPDKSGIRRTALEMLEDMPRMWEGILKGYYGIA
jgi:S-adenosylmethionine synthetase